MIHPQALVDDADAIGRDTNVWAYAHVMAGARVGNCCNIGDHAFVEAGAIVGNNVTVKNGVLIWDGIAIEDDVFVGPGAIFTNDQFPRSPRMPGARQRYSRKSNWMAKTVARRGCSIGAGAVICPGITLGCYSMVAAGAVVTRDVEPHALVAGTPARRVGYVCTCGQKLAGHYTQSDCQVCGETGEARGPRCKETAIIAR
jgi:acetyltransferase-like isoleucine patch superfamily enzyme